jgi:DNA-binding XRE family transcriptional regulator
MLDMADPKRKPGKRKPAAASWAARLKALRERLGITQREAAERADIPLRTWIAWENGQNDPSRSSARLLLITFPELA